MAREGGEGRGEGQDDLASRIEELRARMDADRRSAWLASPVVIAVVGLAGTGLGAVATGFLNARIERQKFEASLIERALSGNEPAEMAKSLKFLAEVGLVNGLNTDKILELAREPRNLPAEFGISRAMPTRDVKAVLAHLKLYAGPMDDTEGPALRKAVADFQASQGMPTDGLVGPMTAARLRAAWPEHFAARTGQ